MDHTQLSELLVILREHGVTKYTNADVSIELGALPVKWTEPTPTHKPQEDPEADLFWSAS